jgi:hypothetical protein
VCWRTYSAGVAPAFSLVARFSEQIRGPSIGKEDAVSVGR